MKIHWAFALLLSVAFGNAGNKNAAKKSSVKEIQPENVPLDSVVLQLDHFASFANGLILTEAMAKNLTNTSTIIIDVLMLGQMPQSKNWVKKIQSAEIRSKKSDILEKKYAETRKLREILENGISSKVDTDRISKMFEVVDGARIVKEIEENAQNVKGLFDAFADYKDVLLVEAHERGITDLVKFPRLMRSLSRVSNPADYIQWLPKFVGIPYSVSENNYFQNAVDAYQNYLKTNDPIQKTAQSGACLQNLKKLVTQDPLESITYEVAEYLSNLMELIALKDLSKLEQLLNNSEKIVALKDQISRIAKIIWNELSANHYNGFLKSMQSLDSLESENQNLHIVLRSLLPVAELSEELHNLYEAHMPPFKSLNESSFVRRFESYSGIRNGTSFEDMTRKLSHLYSLPTQFMHTLISHRSKLVQKLATRMSLMAKHSDGLRLVERVYTFSQAFETRTVMNYSSISNQMEAFKKIKGNLPNVSDVLPMLEELTKRIEEPRNWVDMFTSVKEMFKDASMESELETLTSKIPKLINFVTMLKNIFVDDLMSQDVEKWNHSAVNKSFQNFMDKFESINKSGEVIGEVITSIGRTTHESIQASLTNQMNLITAGAENLAKFSIDDPNFQFSATEIYDSSLNATRAMTQLKELIDKRTDVENILNVTSQLNFLREFFNISSDATLVNSTKLLVEAVSSFAESSGLDKNDAPSDSLSILMEGSPFGASVLAKLHDGVFCYRSLVDGIKSVEDLTAHVETLKSENPGLMKRVENLLVGASVIVVMHEPDVPNVLQNLETIPNITKQLDQVVYWMSNSTTHDLKDITSKLLNLTKNSTANSTDEYSADKLHAFISKLNKETVQSMKNLKIGLDKLHEALVKPNCSKIPTDPNCKKLEEVSSSINASTFSLIDSNTEQTTESIIGILWKIGGCVSFFLALIFAFGCFAYSRLYKNKSKEADKFLAQIIEFQKKAQASVGKIEVKYGAEIEQSTEQMKKLNENKSVSADEKEKALAVYKEKIELAEQKKTEDLAATQEQLHQETIDQKKRVKDAEQKTVPPMDPETDVLDVPTLKKQLEAEPLPSLFHNGNFNFFVEKYVEKPVELVVEVWRSQLARCDTMVYERFEKNLTSAFRFPNLPLYKNQAVYQNLDRTVPQLHANFVVMGDKKWLICAAPANTVDDVSRFYRVLKQNGIGVIIQLGANDESNSGEVDYSYQKKGGNTAFKKTISTGTYAHSKLIWTENNCAPISFDHLHYEKWAYQGVPEDPYIPLELIQTAEKLLRTHEKSKMASGVAVTSMNGTGRAATLAAISFAKKLIDSELQTETKNAAKGAIRTFFNTIREPRVVINVLRQSRSGAVETTSQYGCIEANIAKYITMRITHDAERNRRQRLIEEAYLKATKTTLQPIETKLLAIRDEEEDRKKEEVPAVEAKGDKLDWKAALKKLKNAENDAGNVAIPIETGSRESGMKEGASKVEMMVPKKGSKEEEVKKNEEKVKENDGSKMLTAQLKVDVAKEEKI